MSKKDPDLMEKIVSLCKRRGFVYPGSEIYGGLLKDHLKDAWIRSMRDQDNIALIDSSIFSSRQVWEASGHVSGFSDPLVICKSCHTRHRADHLLEAIGVQADEKMSEKKLNEIFDAHRKELKCSVCGKKDFGTVQAKNLMATSTLGKFEEGDQDLFLRAETAQGIYINYKNILDTGIFSIPFGIAQVGKVFRNEISPRQFLFRMREFEQMEMQYFVNPKDASIEYERWKNQRMSYYETIGIKRINCAGNSMKIWSSMQRMPGIFSTSILSDGMN